MKCPYNNFEWDWPVTTGDIECVECVHYTKKTESASILDWIKKLFTKEKTNQVKNP